MAFLKHTTAAKVFAVCLAAAMGLGTLAGCSPQNTAASQQQSANRQYMSQVNQVMDDLESALGSFTDAVSRDDVVGMQTQAENALATLDDLAAIEAPEELADVHQGYQEGSETLRTALSDYVTLYTEISSATADNPFDWSTYDERLADIQKAYDEGIEKLAAADELAAGKENGTASQEGASASQEGGSAQQADSSAQK